MRLSLFLVKVNIIVYMISTTPKTKQLGHSKSILNNLKVLKYNFDVLKEYTMN